MATWFDLPSEVKQMIFCMISEVDTICYVPKDRRKKVDVRYEEAHHFHDLLLVSKNFITSDEFAFAVLNSAKLRFYSYNELRRLVAEVPRSFKESIRCIEFSRTHCWDDYKNLTDEFKNFSNIETTLSNEMPRLRQIFISWPDHCAQVARWSTHGGAPVQEKAQPSIVRYVLSERDVGDVQAVRMEHTNSLSNIAASFLGNRATKTRWYRWTRPIPWIRRIVQYAENNNIEVIFRIKICFLCVFPYHHYPQTPAELEKCWSAKQLVFRVPRWQHHLEGEMSSKDYIFRVEHDDREYAFYQKLAYDMLHTPGRKGQQYWYNMVAEVINNGENDGF